MSSLRWVSLEGLNGVGKTYLAGRLADRLGSRCVALRELTDLRGEALPARVIAALARSPDAFLRSGHPLAETFAFLALKVHEHEAMQQLAAVPGAEPDVSPQPQHVVLEDRGVDTVAVYQAAVLGGTAPLPQLYGLAHRIHATAALWRALPDLTVLLVDEPAACLARFEQRMGRRLSADERAVLHTADRLYGMLAADDPDRIRVVDRRGRTEDDVLSELQVLCDLAAAGGAGRCKT